MDPSVPIKRRSMLLQCVLFTVTLSFYSIYWFYVTSKEMSDYLRARASRPQEEVLLWTVLLFVPFIQAYPMYKQSELYEVFSGHGVDRWVIFMLWLFFPPAVWFIIQRKLNELASSPEQLSGGSATPALP